MHPTDAAQRNLKRDQNVVVTSRVGSVVLPVEISDDDAGCGEYPAWVGT